MPLLAVAKDKFAKGVSSLETLRAVPWGYAVRELRSALERTYDSDAHCVTYALGGALTSQPRINKPSLPALLASGVSIASDVILVDVDNEAHAKWTAESLHAAMSRYAAWREAGVQTWGIYHTSGGARFVQPLASPVDVSRMERTIEAFMNRLEALGVKVDRACKDWTRHMRMPNVRREGLDYRTPYMDLSVMTPIAIEPVPEPMTKPATARKKRGEVPRVWIEVDETVSSPRIEAIAKAVRSTVTEHWHDMYLAMSGALLQRGMPPAEVPAFVWSVAIGAGSMKPAVHRRGAEDTARRWLDGLPVARMGALYARWRGVAEVVDETMSWRPTKARDDANAAALEATAERMRDAFRNAGDTLTVLSAECGIGKSRAAIDVAVERAKLGKKTVLSFPTNALAKQMAADIRARGESVRRQFGALSETGPHECIHKRIALPLVQTGRQSLQANFCAKGKSHDACERFDTCVVKDGVEGPDDARIVVGNHAELPALVTEVGKTGLLIVDEPPAMVERERISADDFACAVAQSSGFRPTYVRVMGEILDRAAEWQGEEGRHEPVGDVFWGFSTDGALPPERRGDAPPIIRARMAHLRAVGGSEEVGRASRVWWLLWQALNGGERKIWVRKDEGGGLVIVQLNEGLRQAIDRIGSTVVIDANGETHAKVYTRVVGYDVECTKFGADDGAPIERTRVEIGGMSRTGLLPHGRVDLETFGDALAVLRRWLDDGPSGAAYGIATYMPLAIALLGALGESDSAGARWRSDWGARDKAEALVRAELGEWASSGRLGVMYYGNTRGRNDFNDVDGMVTIGDAWPSKDAVDEEVLFLDLDGWDAEERMRAKCVDELEQAHGRLRVVHRKKVGRALHLGRVTPGGTGWGRSDVRVERQRGGDMGGRPKTVGAMSPQEFTDWVESMGGATKAMRYLKMARGTMYRYMTGERSVSEELGEIVRNSR